MQVDDDGVLPVYARADVRRSASHIRRQGDGARAGDGGFAEDEIFIPSWTMSVDEGVAT